MPEKIVQPAAAGLPLTSELELKTYPTMRKLQQIVNYCLCKDRRQ